MSLYQKFKNLSKKIKIKITKSLHSFSPIPFFLLHYQLICTNSGPLSPLLVHFQFHFISHSPPHSNPTYLLEDSQHLLLDDVHLVISEIILFPLFLPSWELLLLLAIIFWQNYFSWATLHPYYPQPQNQYVHLYRTQPTWQFFPPISNIFSYTKQ